MSQMMVVSHCSTSPCPTDSCRNEPILLEFAGVRRNETGICRNGQESTGMELEWTGMALEWTKIDILELREVLAVPPLFLQESGHSSGILVDSGGMEFGRRPC